MGYNHGDIIKLFVLKILVVQDEESCMQGSQIDWMKFNRKDVEEYRMTDPSNWLTGKYRFAEAKLSDTRGRA